VILLSCHESHVWTDYTGDIIMQLMYFPLQQHWSIGFCYQNEWKTNLYHLVQSKWKFSKRQAVLTRN